MYVSITTYNNTVTHGYKWEENRFFFFKLWFISWPYFYSYSYFLMYSLWDGVYVRNVESSHIVVFYFYGKFAGFTSVILFSSAHIMLWYLEDNSQSRLSKVIWLTWFMVLKINPFTFLYAMTKRDNFLFHKIMPFIF